LFNLIFLKGAGRPLGSKRAQGCHLVSEGRGALLKMPSRSTRVDMDKVKRRPNYDIQGTLAPKFQRTVFMVKHTPAFGVSMVEIAHCIAIEIFMDKKK
jgi:hypothetical protein